MHQDVKKLWVDQLNDLGLKQGKGQLRTEDDNFCCLGVLCHIAEEHGVIPKAVMKFDDEQSESLAIRDGENYYVYGLERAGFSLPREVMEWAGLSDADPHIPMTEDEVESMLGSAYLSVCWDGDYYGPSLAGMNDEDVPFSKIAEVIDRKL